MLAIDEAYVAFADYDALDLMRQHPHVIVLRTLSKSHSLAGLRLGFGVAHPDLLAGLAKVKDSYNVDALAARVGAAAIRDTAYAEAVAGRIRASRDRLTDALVRLGFRVWPSQANFLLARPPAATPAGCTPPCAATGFWCDTFAEPGLDETLRITVGTEGQHDRLIAALVRIMA